LICSSESIKGNSALFDESLAELEKKDPSTDPFRPFTVSKGRGLFHADQSGLHSSSLLAIVLPVI
jgi:hypothetical protein